MGFLLLFMLVYSRKVFLSCVSSLYSDFGQGFLAEGLQRTSAGLGSVIIDSQPLTVALLASLLLGEQLSIAGYAGLAVGVLGLCLLEVPPNLLASLPSIFTCKQSDARLQCS